METLPEISVCIPKPEYQYTDEDIDGYTKILGEKLKAHVRAARVLEVAKQKEMKSRQELNTVKDDMRQLSYALMGI